VRYWPSIWKKITLPALPRLVGDLGANSRSSDFAQLFTQLREAALNLKKSSAGLEVQFLATSSELDTLAGLGDRFVKQVGKLVGLASGRDCDSTVFSSAIRLIGQATQFLDKCQEETGRMLELLRHEHGQIEHLLRMENELQRTMMPLKFVQTLFKSESAPLGVGVQQMFSSLTHEIESLHGQVREIFGTKFKQLEDTRTVIGNVIVQLEKQARLLEQVVATHKAQIESSLKTVQKEMNANQARDTRLDGLSRDLARDVEQVVMGLQFQDIINQKLQHVTAALSQIEAKFAGLNSSSDDAASAEPWQFLYQSCRLEAEQIQSAQEELANAESSIRNAIQKVLAQVTEVDSQCLSLDEFSLLTTSFDGMVQVLVETIEEVRELVTTTMASATEVYEILKPLGSLASDLTIIVRDLSARIHLIGLNAQVQAARAAQDRRGTGLEVLSARTSEISEETNRISEQAAAGLDALARGLAESVRVLEQLRANGLTQQNILNEQGCAEEQQLHAFRDHALETLREIGASFDEIRKQTQEALDTVHYARFYQVTLPALRAPLLAIADLAQRRLRPHDLVAAQTNSVEGFKRDYTMQSEHKVFAEVISGEGSANPPPQSTAAASEPAVELFADSPAGKDVQPDAGAEPQQELPVEKEVPATSSGSDLGANVELF
jgi:hypothetical protein